MIEQISKAVQTELSENAPMELPLPVLTLRQRVLQSKLNLSSLYGHWQLWRASRRKYIWKCYAYYGGGQLVTPRPMRSDQAVKWLKRMVDGSVAYIDHEVHFIFYKPRQ